MPRVAITPQAATGPYGAAGLTLSYQASDSSSGNKVVASGKDLIFCRNTDVGAQTVTITSSADEKGRLGNITTESIAAGATHIFGPLPKLGWQQTGGVLFIDTSDNTVKLAVVQL